MATKVVAKYQTASCEQLWQQKNEPKPQEEQRAVQFLKNDPQARTAFINKIAGPVVNKIVRMRDDSLERPDRGERPCLKSARASVLHGGRHLRDGTPSSLWRNVSVDARGPVPLVRTGEIKPLVPVRIMPAQGSVA